ncbi:hypothetical protein N9O16_00840 [Candidatus Poseidoniaceae archaeon]|nr:hypothetical protein [Euryarchaeota archaeon]MDA9166016.1 hypothetical protein [Candidatus Poseidoniaceae archaeon]
MNSMLKRDEEAVSAAVATVLLFGGVLSIIAMMMVSLIPVIEELEGSIERHDMSAQMTLMAHQTSALSETGMPGDSTEINLIPVDGTLNWNMMQSSMWYSATWADDTSFRVQGALDYDDELRIRHPESMNTAVCIDDLRLGPSNPYIFTIPEWVDEVLLTASPGLALPLGPIEVEVLNGSEKLSEIQLMVDGMHLLDASGLGETIIHSSHQLHLLFSVGNGGTDVIQPNDPSPVDSTGSSWSIPLPAGENKIQVLSESANQITIRNDTSSTYYALPSNQNRVGVDFTHQFNLTSPEVVHVSTSSPSRLILQTNSNASVGQMALPSINGQHLGHSFMTPTFDGELVFSNPGTDSVTVTWRGGGLSVPANQSSVFPWPPADTNGAPMLDANGDVFVTWRKNASGSGLQMEPADDTGASSGQLHTIQNDQAGLHRLHITHTGHYTEWNMTGSSEANGTFLDDSYDETVELGQGVTQIRVTDGDALRIYSIRGQNGLLQAMHDGAQRCLPINIQASGWISADLPWQSMSGRSQVDLKNAWRAGNHPASMQISLIGENGASNYATLGTVWGFHLSRLSYEFQSSISGMEVAYAGGAVVTNHPEFEPHIVVSPSDRGGPGPRFAATVPSLHPTADSVSGSGNMNLDIELVDRSSLASAEAYEVRRGWASPYGVAIAQSSADGLEASEDWTVYPGRIDLLNDYVGWVPDPSYGTSEAIWHTNGEAIQFTLQIADLSAHMTEAVS